MRAFLIIATWLCIGLAGLRGEIDIISITPGTKGNCDGSVVVRATGTAGPFVVHIPGTGWTFTDVTGDITLDGLCQANTYDIEVYATRFPSCVTTLEATLLTPPAASFKRSAPPLTALSLEVVPNPNRGRFQLHVAAATEPGADFSWSVSVRDAQGRLRYRNARIEPDGKSAGRTVLPLDLGAVPPGFYYVQVTDPTGRMAWARVVVQ